MKHPVAKDPHVLAALQAAIQSGAWCSYYSEYNEQVQLRLAELCQRKHVQLCCTGTIATELALRGLGVKAGDEVILCAYDFPGNFRAIENIGATAVLVDCGEASWCLDPHAVEAALSDRCKAIVVSHLHGENAPVQHVAKFHVPIVEDACQNIGAIIAGRPVGGWGAASTLSFGGSKLITAGRGGAVLVDEDRVAQRMRVFRDQGNDAYAMSGLQAAAILPQLDHLSACNRQRLTAVEQLESRLVGKYSWLTFPPTLADDSQNMRSFYKWGFWVVHPETLQPDAEFRQRVVNRLLSKAIHVGEGFRSLARRAKETLAAEGGRCRTVSDLKNSHINAASTILMHHDMLLREDAWLDLFEATLDDINQSK